MTIQGPEEVDNRPTETEVLLREAIEAEPQKLNTQEIPAADPGANEGISP